jgi:phospholipid/cholesterol/gamma-HCH transport system ATP-binding protein
MPDQPILEFSNVSLRYDQTWALHNISLRLKAGETRIIFGQAGSGKTSLLKAGIGLIPIDSGDIRMFGQDVTNLDENHLYDLRSRAGFLFQEGGLFDSLSVGENVAYPIVNSRSVNDGKKKPVEDPDEVERRIRETLRFVELESSLDKFPDEISGGMRRRVGIARAIVIEPPLLFYDSPTAGLDPITANNIMSLVAKERDVRNSASLIVTNRYQDGELMEDFRYDPEQELLVPLIGEDHPKRDRTKFLVMRDGEIVFAGSRREMESSKDDYVQKFVRHED